MWHLGPSSQNRLLLLLEAADDQFERREYRIYFCVESKKRVNIFIFYLKVYPIF